MARDLARRPHSPRGYGALVLAIALLFARTVRADGPDFNILLLPSFSFLDRTDSDPFGNLRHQRSMDVLGTYRLTLRHELFPQLRYSVRSLLDQRHSFTSTDGQEDELHLFGGNVAGIVSVGGPLFGADVGYVWRTIAVPEQTQISQTFSVVGRMAPSDLPKLDLRYSHAMVHDTDRRLQDNVTNDFQATLSYRRGAELDARYLFGYQSVVDRLDLVSTEAITHSGRLNYRKAFFGGRLSFAANYTLDGRQVDAEAQSSTGLIETQRIPLGGLSLIDDLPPDPVKNTLQANIALIDGDYDAGAAINIGFGADEREKQRDIGASFAAAINDVNMLYVWVDRQLPTEAQQFAWAAYISDDNITWTPQPLRAPVVYDPIRRRFEIPIERTRARFFKVVTTPLSPAATADERMRDIFVTEFQLFLIVPVGEAPNNRTDLSHTAQVTAIARLTRSGSLQADVSLRGVLVQLPELLLAYRATEGLTYQRAWRKWSIRGRVARDDRDEGDQHVGGMTWLASCVFTPWTTLRHSLVYNGNRYTRNGSTTIHTLNLFNRADIYRGVSLLVSGGGSMTYPEQQEEDQFGIAARAGLSLEPHRSFKLTGSYNYQKIRYLDDPAKREIFSDFVHGSLVFTPLPALSISAQLSRLRSPKPRLLADFSVSVAPFPEGNLRISASYFESVDPANDAFTRRATGSVRWNIAPPLLLDGSFTYLWTETEQEWSRSYIALTMLTVRL